MSVGRAAHLYAGAMRRGRSDLTVSTLGVAGRNGSLGQASEESVVGRKVGEVKMAELVCAMCEGIHIPQRQIHTVDGYMGTMNSLSVAVA